MQPEFAATWALWILLALAMAIATRAHAPDRDGVTKPALLVLAIQPLHVAEEFATGFQRRFPERLGLAPWSDEFFVTLNMLAIAIWALALLGLQRGAWRLAVSVALWFLALTATANGVAHPLMALDAGGYFPGLVTAPFLGGAGILLLHALTRHTAQTGSGING